MSEARGGGVQPDPDVAVVPAPGEVAGVATTLPPHQSRLPQRGGRVWPALGAAAMRLTGWRVDGTLPDEPKMVIAVAPHTSNWDFPVGVMAMFALGLHIHWLGKHTLFAPPLGPVMRWLGGTPVRRSEPQQAVTGVVDAFARHERFLLALSPEGTRRPVPRWRTGFYHIARGAGVPILPVALDWSRRLVRIFPPVVPTGDEPADLALIRAFFRSEMGRRPEGYVE